MTRVLDHGLVQLIGHMAGDHAVVGAARVSIGRTPEEASKGPDSDAKLIGYLMRNGHGTPFEHAVFQWYVKAPLFVVREWQRHRWASYNEQSARYSEMPPEFYVPDHVRAPDPGNKQSSVRVDPLPQYENGIINMVRSAGERAYADYDAMLALNVAREMARMVLPLNLYTSFWFTINARSLMNFLALRNHPAAQWEIAQYAAALEQDFATLMPITHAAFNERRVAP